MTEPDAGLIELFRDETTQRLDQMDGLLLTIEAGEGGAGEVDSLFRDAHTIKGGASMLGLDNIRALAHGVEDVLASARDAETLPSELAASLLRATAALRAQLTGAGEPVGDLLDDLAASRAKVATGSVADPSSAPSPGSAAVNPARAQAAGPLVTEATAGQARAREQEASRPASPRPTLRVPADKIDHLLDVTGEIMQDRRRLAHSLGARQRLSPDLADVLGAGQRRLDDLMSTAVGMRTLPLTVISVGLPRVVRDIARSAGKEVEFVIRGADTELDRVILESLSEPLGHLLRNAVVHGIESAAERGRAGKPARGQVELRAVPRGSLVEIAVADDGRGASTEVIKNARRQGSLADLLAEAGYSTAETVTDLAGRGVGLDAVKTYVRSLGGSLDIRSEPGQGMEVILLLPVALALIEVLLFERGGAVYGVPLAAVEEVLTVTQTSLLQGRAALELRGSSLPVTDFAELIGARAPPLRPQPPGLIITAGGRRAITTCDALLGQEEVVVKPLGPLLAGVEGYLGAAILGDGRIALLVEPAGLTRRSRRQPGPAAPAAAAAPKVLVVEDSFTVRELQRSILEAAGYPVATARDGRDALGVLGRDPQIALVVTDLEMPELDGIGLTRAIRADPARSSLPVVVVTARASQDDRRRGIDAGADAYMVKRDFDQQALLATVGRLVGR